MVLFERALVVVRGGGDLASGVIYRLFKAGFPVIVTELAAPLLVRRTVSYGDAVYTHTTTVEGVTARLTPLSNLQPQLDYIPVVIDPLGECLALLRPVVVIDARMAKVNLGTTLQDAPFVVALGPGFYAGVDCHAVIETNRGHNLGRVIYHAAAEPDTGEPGKVEGQTHTRVLRAPTDGSVQAEMAIGDTAQAGQLIATVSGTPVYAPFTGVLRGLVHEQVCVSKGMKIGDLDPRIKREHCFTLSDKSLAVGGGVLEAVLSARTVQESLR